MSDVSLSPRPAFEAEIEALPTDHAVPSVRTKVRKTMEQNKKYTREKCIECSSCKGNNQHLKRNYQGSSEQTPAFKSCSEDQLIDKKSSPSSGRKHSKVAASYDDESEGQADNGPGKGPQSRCYSCGRRKSRQDDECCGDRGGKGRAAKDRSDDHYYDTRISDFSSKHFQEKSIFPWNAAQSGRVWTRHSSLLLPYEWEDDCEMIDWVIDQYVHEDSSISAFYKGRLILTLKDALGITTVTADAGNLPRSLQAHVFEANIPTIPEVLWYTLAFQLIVIRVKTCGHKHCRC